MKLERLGKDVPAAAGGPGIGRVNRIVGAVRKRRAKSLGHARGGPMDNMRGTL